MELGVGESFEWGKDLERGRFGEGWNVGELPQMFCCRASDKTRELEFEEWREMIRYVVSTACFLGKGATFNFLTFSYDVYGLINTHTHYMTPYIC